MENKFYVGDIYHKRRLIKPSYYEKTVLYTEDEKIFLDLLKEKCYTANENEKDFIIISSLVPTNINDYRTDYLYLLEKNKEKKRIKK